MSFNPGPLRSAISRRIAGALTQIERRAREGSAEAFKDFCNELIDNTPVKTGFARSHWRFSVSGKKQPANKDYKKGDRRLPPPRQRLGRTVAAIKRHSEFTATVYNDTRYFVFIEYGGQNTPPYAVVRRALANLNNIIKRNIT